jgi:Ca-activated chloride channel family protein
MSARLFLLAALVFVALSGCSPSSVGQAKDPGALTFEGALSNRYVASGEASPALARLRIGTVAPPEADKPSVNLALVVDTSGSMEGQPIEDARAASMAMIDALAEGDRLAVVVFHSKAEVLLPSTPVDADNRAEIKAQLKAMKAQGTTDMGSGLQAGLDEVYAHLEPRGINRVVLLGDGVPNEEGRIRSMASEAGSRGVTITALGLGLDYNESLMGAVAQASGGRFHYIERSEEVASFFKEEVLRLQGVLARNATLELTPGPGVRIEGVVGHPVYQNGAKVQVTLGDFSRGDKRD